MSTSVSSEAKRKVERNVNKRPQTSRLQGKQRIRETSLRPCHVIWFYRSAEGKMSPPSTALENNTEPYHHPVSSLLPEYLRRALPYKRFNKMQAECLETWESDANMLISAPTGAGKTVCFELAILRNLHQTIGTSQKKRLTSKGLEGKIVYIAPTKSLCSERAKDWQQKFKHLGLRVQVITGDAASSTFDTTIRNTDLVVATAEKWDSVTRNLGSTTPSELSAQIRLLLLDEVHHVGDSRGAVFESVVTRMLFARDISSRQMSSGGRALPAASLRIIAVSATASNITDIGKWLRVSEANTKVFDETYRPVALEYHVLGYTARNPWVYGKVYDNHILKVITEYGGGKPCIVFCTSRRQTITSAQTLLDKLNGSLRNQRNPFLLSLSEEQKSLLVSCAEQCSHTLLRSSLPQGIAVHNADMNARTRTLVETMFRDSLIGCLFSTSTLAQGVNLPARLVVIAGTTIYNNGCLEEYQRNLLLQMCGRAGRPGLDSKGVVVIMTAMSQVGAYGSIGKNSSNVLSSQLSRSITESVNAEVARQVITDVPSAIEFLSSTLFWTQSNSLSTAELGTRNPNDETGLHGVAVKAINTLCDTNLVQYDADHFGLSCTLAGTLMAKYCLSVDTMRQLSMKVPTAASPSQILRIIASCPEVKDMASLRRSDKKRLNAMNEWIRMPVRGKVQETTDKIVVLLQVVIGDQKDSCSSDVALRGEGQRLLQLAARVSACIVAMVLHGTINVKYETAVAVLHVCRGLQNRCLWDGSTVLRQVPGISVSDMRVLNKAGIYSLAKLAQLNTEVLERELGCRSAFAATIDDRLRVFPRFLVKAEVLRQKGTQEQRFTISVSVDVVSMQGNDKPRQRRSVICFIMIGRPSIDLLGCHVFPLSAGRGSFNCLLPREADHMADGWIEVRVGCDNLCGIDVTTRVWTEKSQISPPADRRHSPRSSEKSRHKLSVTEGRVTKKLSQTKLMERDKSDPKPSPAHMLPLRKSDNKLPIKTFRKSDSLVNAKNGLEGRQAPEQAKAKEIAATALKTPTSAVSTKATRNVPKRSEQLLEPTKIVKQTPARSESHIAVLPNTSIEDSGKEYDDVFRALF